MFLGLCFSNQLLLKPRLGFNGRQVLTSSNDDERAYTRRYTDEGINVVALDPNNRSLYRARPEPGLRSRYPTNRFTGRLTGPAHFVGSWLASLVFGVLLLVAIGLAIARYVA